MVMISGRTYVSIRRNEVGGLDEDDLLNDRLFSAFGRCGVSGRV